MAGTADHSSLVPALGWAQGQLQTLQEQQLTGLADAQRALEDALGAVLQEEEWLWAQARKERAQLQQDLATLHDANWQVVQAGTAKIQALRHQLASLHTRLLASPAPEQPVAAAQEVANLVARLTHLPLKLTWATFVPLRATLSLGRLKLEEQLCCYLPGEKACSKGGQRDSSQPRERGGEGQLTLETQLEGGSTFLPQESRLSGLSPNAAAAAATLEKQTECRGERRGPLFPPKEMALGAGQMLGVAAEKALLPAPGEALALYSQAGETPGVCPLLAEEGEGQGTEAETRSRVASGLPEPEGTFFRATAVWLRDEPSDSSSSNSRPPSLPRWASVDSLTSRGRRGGGGAAALGGSCVELARAVSTYPDAAPGLCLPPRPCDQLVGRWGSRGSRPGQLCLPHGLCAAPASGALFVVDAGNRRLQVLVGAGRAWRALQLPGTVPFDVARGRGGCLAVTRLGRKPRVELFAAEGRLLHALAEGFAGPRGLSSYGADGGAFLVADVRQGALHVLGVTAGGRRLVRREAVRGFRKPYLVASNARGEVAVSERGLDGGCCVKVLGTGWQVLRVLGAPGGSPPRLTSPWGVALDEAGRALVADWGRRSHAVLCYPPQGPGWPVATEGLCGPCGVALLGERHLVVADSMHHCLKSFRY